MTTEKTYAVIGCPWCKEVPIIENRLDIYGKWYIHVGCNYKPCAVKPFVFAKRKFAAVAIWNGNRTGTLYHIKVAK